MLKDTTIRFKKMFDNVELPKYATAGSAGFDIIVNNFRSLHTSPDGQTKTGEVKFNLNVDEVRLYPGQRLLIGAGYAVAIPENTQLEVRSRSGKTLKEGLICLNAPGTVDEDYRGEIGAILYNAGGYSLVVKKGDAVAQGVLMPYIKASFEIADDLSSTERGAGGYGSTDKKTETAEELLKKEFSQEDYIHLDHKERFDGRMGHDPTYG